MPNPKSPGGAAARKAARKSQEYFGEHHNRSQSNNGNQTMKRAKKAVTKANKKMSRWFGIADPNTMEAMQKGYVQKKADMTAGNAHKGAPYGRKSAMITQRSTGAHQKSSFESDSSSSSDSEEELVVGEDIPKSQKKFTRSLQQGLTRYRKLRNEERMKQVKPGWFGGQVNKRRDSVIEGGFEKRNMGAEAPKRKHSNIRDQTLVALQLEAMPTYYPWFTYGMCQLQLVLLLCILAHAYTDGSFAQVGLASKFSTCASNECPDDFNGQIDVNFEVLEEVNWTVGPTTKYLLALGAKFAPCMREEDKYSVNAARVRAEQCVYQNAEFNCVTEFPDGQAGYGCCSSISGRLGMTSFEQCRTYFNEALESDPSSSLTEDDFPGSDNSTIYWAEGDLCTDSGFLQSNIVLRPCCGIRLNETQNHCEIMTQKECELREGAWQTDKLMCSETMCLTTICNVMSELRIGNSFEIEADDEIKNIPDNPNQWWRLFIPLFLHSGIIHAVLILAVQYYCGKNIEVTSGFLRILLIYLISGIGGNLISGIFSPNTVSVGPDPAVYGLIGVMFVELLQAWQVVPDPYFQLFKLSVIIVISLLIGTFPYIDNWSHIGGFFFGVVSGIVFLPYITFGKWDARRKKILLMICVPLLFMMLLAAFITFYKIQNGDFCTWCPYLNCIEYSSEIDCTASVQG